MPNDQRNVFAQLIQLAASAYKADERKQKSLEEAKVLGEQYVNEPMQGLVQGMGGGAQGALDVGGVSLGAGAAKRSPREMLSAALQGALAGAGAPFQAGRLGAESLFPSQAVAAPEVPTEPTDTTEPRSRLSQALRMLFSPAAFKIGAPLALAKFGGETGLAAGAGLAKGFADTAKEKREAAAEAKKRELTDKDLLELSTKSVDPLGTPEEKAAQIQSNFETLKALAEQLRAKPEASTKAIQEKIQEFTGQQTGAFAARRKKAEQAAAFASQLTQEGVSAEEAKRRAKAKFGL